MWSWPCPFLLNRSWFPFVTTRSHLVLTAIVLTAVRNQLLLPSSSPGVTPVVVPGVPCFAPDSPTYWLLPRVGLRSSVPSPLFGFWFGFTSRLSLNRTLRLWVLRPHLASFSSLIGGGGPTTRWRCAARQRGPLRCYREAFAIFLAVSMVSSPARFILLIFAGVLSIVALIANFRFISCGVGVCGIYPEMSWSIKLRRPPNSQVQGQFLEVS